MPPAIQRLSTLALLAGLCAGQILGAPAAHAHTGVPLDAEGCHVDGRTRAYHCHRGDAAGCSFPDKAAMQKAVSDGRLPEATVDADGFFSRLWPFGPVYEQEEAPATGAPASGPPAAAPASAAQQKASERLQVLKGLLEMGLITREEYEVRRQAVLDEL
jgi:hypothetical protein